MDQNKRMVLSEMCIKLNIGCGYDPREGFVNIDGRNDLPKVDRVINLSKESLLKYLGWGRLISFWPMILLSITFTGRLSGY